MAALVEFERIKSGSVRAVIYLILRIIFLGTCCINIYHNSYIES